MFFLKFYSNKHYVNCVNNSLRITFADICISDFTLHSIGVVTFRKNKANLFTQFTQDMLPHLDVLTLPKSDYAKINTVVQSLNLDFDDAYQYSIAKCYDLKLVTLDKDFKDLNLNDVQVIFLHQA
ncbi:conserved hypothetical protein [Beggiatoa sp. PS]|nr:conserved hypothetical protein [Beggiatoa sp. PS]